MSYLASKLQAGPGKFAPLPPSVGGAFFANGIYTSRANTIHSVSRVYILRLLGNQYLRSTANSTYGASDRVE